MSLEHRRVRFSQTGASTRPRTGGEVRDQVSCVLHSRPASTEWERGGTLAACAHQDYASRSSRLSRSRPRQRLLDGPRLVVICVAYRPFSRRLDMRERVWIPVVMLPVTFAAAGGDGSGGGHGGLERCWRPQSASRGIEREVEGSTCRCGRAPRGRSGDDPRGRPGGVDPASRRSSRPRSARSTGWADGRSGPGFLSLHPSGMTQKTVKEPRPVGRWLTKPSRSGPAR